MPTPIIETPGDIKTYGTGSAGGKGDGLILLNETSLLKVNPLKTRILATDFYDRFLANGNAFRAADRSVVESILAELGDIPLGVRSSATSEAGRQAAGPGSVHAGENASFMLPNNHPESGVRFSQTLQAIYHIYKDFRERQPPDSREKMAIVLNPIPGILDDTLAGPVYYPYISGVATSFFPYALKNQDPWEGFARIAFGHGYATVLDDFPVLCMATIRNPIPLELLRIGKGQQFFYALDLTKNRELRGEELETMRRLHVRFANYHKIRLLGIQDNLITIEELVQKNHFDFQSGLVEIMETIGARICPHFQIEFVFNLDFSKKDKRQGTFHIVQLTRLPEFKYDFVAVPERRRHTYLSANNAQGHGVIRNIKFAVVVSPFIYAKEMQAAVRSHISRVNQEMRSRAGKIRPHHPGTAGKPEPGLGHLCRIQGRGPGRGHL